MSHAPAHGEDAAGPARSRAARSRAGTELTGGGAGGGAAVPRRARLSHSPRRGHPAAAGLHAASRADVPLLDLSVGRGTDTELCLSCLGKWHTARDCRKERAAAAAGGSGAATSRSHRAPCLVSSLTPQPRMTVLPLIKPKHVAVQPASPPPPRPSADGGTSTRVMRSPPPVPLPSPKVEEAQRQMRGSPTSFMVNVSMGDMNPSSQGQGQGYGGAGDTGASSSPTPAFIKVNLVPFDDKLPAIQAFLIPGGAPFNSGAFLSMSSYSPRLAKYETAPSEAISSFEHFPPAKPGELGNPSPRPLESRIKASHAMQASDENPASHASPRTKR